MACSKPFTFLYWFSHLRTRQKQLSLATKISIYSRRVIVYKALKWSDACQIVLILTLSWNGVIFLYMFQHWSKQLYYRTNCYEIGLKRETSRAEKYVCYLIYNILDSLIGNGISYYYNLPRNKHTKVFQNEDGSFAKPTSVSVTWAECVITAARGQGLCWFPPLCTEPWQELSQSPSLPCSEEVISLAKAGVGMKDSARMALAVPRVHWHSWIQPEGLWELLLSSSGCSAWADFFWKSRYVMRIWTQIVLGTSSEGSIFTPSVLLLHELSAQKLSWSKVCLWILSVAEHL